MEGQRPTLVRFDPATGDVSTQTMPPHPVSDKGCLFWEVPFGTTANDVAVIDGDLYFPPPRPVGPQWRFDPASGSWQDTRSAEEVADTLWQEVRTTRDRLLEQSDKTQIPDYPISDDMRRQWAEYREALRDLPAVMNDPANPVWPTPPES